MNQNPSNRVWLAIVLFALVIFVAGCATSANSRYYGETVPPSANILRYITGSEPESLDPQITNGQPEARIHMSMFEGLVEYDPKDMHPIPAIAESWEISPKIDELIFHLRKNARWSDGKAITANDFVYSFRRAFAPETVSRTAELGFFIKYAQAFNGKYVFVRKNGEFLLAKDFAENPVTETTPTTFGAETEFHKFIKSPDRLILNGDEKERAKKIEADPKLKAAFEGAELVPVKAEDIGIEAIDDYTIRITLRQSAPFFLGLLAHQLFRLVPQQAIEKHGRAWTRPENIVTNGAFKVKAHRQYDVLIVERDPNYWDAANVKLDGIEFYPSDDAGTTMNLYKTGYIDAFYNHVVPASWIDDIRPFKAEYLNFPENNATYYSINIKKPPFDNLKVRQAFNLSIDKDLLAKFRKIVVPLYDLSPTGIFPEYDQARKSVSEEMRQKSGLSEAEWEKRKKFNPDRARQLLTEAGFAVNSNGGGFTCPSFPADKIALSYNTLESNRQIAEFMQAQWKQNLGVTVPLKNMEFKTFQAYRNAVEYEGFAQFLWSGDYVDPYTFLGLQYGVGNNGGSGFADPQYDRMLDEANNELDTTKRYEKLARAEAYVMDQQLLIPVYVPATNWMKKPYVKGLYPNSGTLHAWKYVYIERDPAKWETDAENIMNQ
ncbi:MAG: peptide ABC transporter substrate-binding protein [Pyrinomonadaceae bacterium]